MGSRIEVKAIYQKEKFSDVEILSFKRRCKYLEWYFKRNYQTDIHVIVEIWFRDYLINPTTNDFIVQCLANRELTNDLGKWIKKNESQWRFVLDKRLELSNDDIITLPNEVSLKRTPDNIFIVTTYYDNKQIEFEDYSMAIKEFKSFV